MELHYRSGDETTTARVTRLAPERFRVAIADGVHEIEVRRAQGGTLDLIMDGRLVRAHAAEDGPRRFVKLGAADPITFLRAETRRPGAGRARAAGGDDALTANMHAQVVAILVKEGDAVERGATLVVLEAMKMEMRVAAPHAGRVKAVGCKVGEVVERGRVLVELE